MYADQLAVFTDSVYCYGELLCAELISTLKAPVRSVHLCTGIERPFNITVPTLLFQIGFASCFVFEAVEKLLEVLEVHPVCL